MCFIILEAQDVVVLKAGMTIARNTSKDSLKVLKHLPYLLFKILFFITGLCILAAEVNCEKLHMLKGLELVTIPVNLAKNNSFHVLVRRVQAHRIHKPLKLPARPRTLPPLCLTLPFLHSKKNGTELGDIDESCLLPFHS